MPPTIPASTPLERQDRPVLWLVRFDDYVIHAVNPPAAPAHQAAQAEDRPPPPPMTTYTEPLTGREQEVLRVAAMGLSNAEIAASLMITPGTVKWHLRNIYSKLGVRRRTQAIAAARARGLLLD